MVSKKPVPQSRERQRLGDAHRHAIATRLKILRAMKGYNQKELAQRAGIDPASMNQIEQGHRAPDLATLYALAAQLEVPPAALLEVPATPERHAQPSAVSAASGLDLSGVLRAELHRTVTDLVGALVSALGHWHESHAAAHAPGEILATRNGTPRSRRVS